MKNILVTGGAGFIGSHLCRRLLESEDNNVICLDNLYSGDKRNILELTGNPRFEFVRHDVCNPYYCEVQEIYNLACPASPIFYQNDPIQTCKTSFLGAYHMLGLAKRTGARILQASTSEIYGDPKEHPQHEGYWGNVSCTGIRSCYDEGKRVAESLFNDYYRKHGVDIRIVRIFNTYGPRMRPDDGRVISNFVVQALNNEDITIYGDGSQTRSFQYVDDLVEGMIRLMNLDYYPGAINIGNPGEYTIRELAEKVLEMIPESKSEIVYRELPDDDPVKRKPDIARAKRYLDWEPTVDLEEGLTKTIEYFRKQKNQQ